MVDKKFRGGRVLEVSRSSERELVGSGIGCIRLQPPHVLELLGKLRLGFSQTGHLHVIGPHRHCHGAKGTLLLTLLLTGVEHHHVLWQLLEIERGPPRRRRHALRRVGAVRARRGEFGRSRRQSGPTAASAGDALAILFYGYCALLEQFLRRRLVQRCPSQHFES